MQSGWNQGVRPAPFLLTLTFIGAPQGAIECIANTSIARYTGSNSLGSTLDAKPIPIASGRLVPSAPHGAETQRDNSVALLYSRFVWDLRHGSLFSDDNSFLLKGLRSQVPICGPARFGLACSCEGIRGRNVRGMFRDTASKCCCVKGLSASCFDAIWKLRKTSYRMLNPPFLQHIVHNARRSLAGDVRTQLRSFQGFRCIGWARRGAEGLLKDCSCHRKKDPTTEGRRPVTGRA